MYRRRSYSFLKHKCQCKGTQAGPAPSRTFLQSQERNRQALYRGLGCSGLGDIDLSGAEIIKHVCNACPTPCHRNSRLTSFYISALLGWKTKVIYDKGVFSCLQQSWVAPLFWNTVGSPQRNNTTTTAKQSKLWDRSQMRFVRVMWRQEAYIFF